MRSSEGFVSSFQYFLTDFVVEFDVLIVESVLHRRIIVAWHCAEEFFWKLQEFDVERRNIWTLLDVLITLYNITCTSTSFGQ